MAAGLASRMGQDKLALPWGDSTILGHVIDTALRAGQLLEPEYPGTELVVVARRPVEAYLNGQRLGEFIQSGATWLDLPAYQPLAEIIKTGLCCIGDETLGIGFVPGDQVGIEPAMLKDLLVAFLANRPDFLLPAAEGIKGSPVIFHRRYLPQLLELKGEQGGKHVLERFRERWSMFPVNPGFFTDIDTPEDYLAQQRRTIG